MSLIVLLQDAASKVRLARGLVKVPESIDTLKAVSLALQRVVEVEAEAAQLKVAEPPHDEHRHK